MEIIQIFNKFIYRLGNQLRRQTIKSIGRSTTLSQILHQIEQAEFLLITNIYPSSKNLYRNMFVHKRVKNYLSKGLEVQVFILNKNQVLPTIDVFEGVLVIRGDGQVLKDIIVKIRLKKILVHFINRDIFKAIQDSNFNNNVLIWLHGAETQSWRRRNHLLIFNSPSNILKTIYYIFSNNNRIKFIKSLYLSADKKYHFIFVSNWLKNDVEKDLKVSIKRYSIINNVVDEKVFIYVPKTKKDRLAILTIKPFVNKTYATDLVVKTILALSKKQFFKELSFTIVGDGPLFTSETEPLTRFPNVTCSKQFLDHQGIKKLHDQHGIFLSPTKMDSQGVSMCEAASSGLVPVTSRVAAIPEFINNKMGFLAPYNDYKYLTQSISKMYFDSNLFLSKSKEASARIQKKCKVSATIDKEITLIKKVEVNCKVIKNLKSLKIALVADGFTWRNFEGVCKVKSLTSDNAEELSEWADLLFIESAWLGNNRIWEHKISNSGFRDNTEIKSIIRVFKTKSVPTIFWNKEDPFHFKSFINTARECDFVFTTDSNMIKKYKKAGCKNISILPFFFNPRMYNPINEMERKNKIVFAGAYYGKKYQERKKFMDMIAPCFEEFGLDIYDRNLNNANSPNQFPTKLKKFIRGYLSEEKIIMAYKGYKVNINANSITNSTTMFARRIVEILACNTPIISSIARSIQVRFPFIIASSDINILHSEAKKLFDDEKYYHKKQILGVRTVFANYNIKDKLVDLGKIVGITILNSKDLVRIEFCDKKLDRQTIIDLYRRQTYKNIIDPRKKGSQKVDYVLKVTSDLFRKDIHLVEDLVNAYKYLAKDIIVTKNAGNEYTWVKNYNKSCYITLVNSKKKISKVFNINNST